MLGKTLFAFLLTCSTIFAAFDENTVVRCFDGRVQYSGTVIHPDGLILTAKHCVAHNPARVEVKFLNDEKTYIGKVIAMSELTEGPALISLPKGNYPYVRIAETPEDNGKVTAYGYPEMTFELNRARGILSGGPRMVRMDEGYLLIGSGPGSFDTNRLSVPVIGGYSGGAVINESGKLVGVISATSVEHSLHITLCDVIENITKWGITGYEYKPNSNKYKKNFPMKDSAFKFVQDYARTGPIPEDEECMPDGYCKKHSKMSKEPQLNFKKPFLYVYLSKTHQGSRIWEQELNVSTEAGQELRKRYNVIVVYIEEARDGWARMQKQSQTATQGVPFYIDTTGKQSRGYTAGDAEKFLQFFTGSSTKQLAPEELDDEPIEEEKPRTLRIVHCEEKRENFA